MLSSEPGHGTLVLVPNALDFGSAQPCDLRAHLPLAVIERAAALPHWVVENAKTTRAFLKRVAAIAPLTAPLQSLQIVELARASATSADLDALLRPALQGHDIGLLSEAGLAAVADPGSALVARAHALGIGVDPLPGASSLMLALAASGLNGQQFAFVGYLPVPDEARAARIRELDALSKRTGQTQIAIETPYRNTALFAALTKHLAPATRLGVACAIGWPIGWCKTQPVSRWRQAAPALDERLPAVFVFQA
ncbi:MAG: SAM-dependent methyltransferase [Burkholderiaceae bacterium]|nr:SAM-dependent methyltransferase [Burkholderiaceae bacterium]